MGTIASLLDHASRAHGQAGRCAVTVTGFGFALGGRAIAWQAVSEIWAYRVDLVATGEAFLEFVAGADRLAVSERQTGFDSLATAMAEVFPSTTHWRDLVLQSPLARNRTLLYRRT